MAEPPSPPPTAGPPLQRRELAVDPAVLQRFNKDQASQLLDRLTADNELLDRLMFRSYAGPEFEEFQDLCIRYGITVIRAWCRTGEIFTRCAQKGRPVQRQIEVPADEAEDLALEVVAEAWNYFLRKVLIPRTWNPSRGATIKSFFIGACVLFFPKVYRRWEGHERQQHGLLDGDVPHERGARNDSDPAVQLVDREPLAVFCASLEPSNAAIVRYRVEEDLTVPEIAELCGLSEKAVKQRLHRLRKQFPKYLERRSA